MRRIIPLLALMLALGSCGGDDSSESANFDSPQDGTSETAAALPETTVVEDETTTTAAPDETTTTSAADETTATTMADSADTVFQVIPDTPPAVFDSFTSTMTVQMGLGDEVFEITSDGAWTGDAFECTMAMAIGGLTFSQSVVGAGETIWFDDGTGFEQSTVNATTEDVVASCGASPSFWEDFVNPGVDISGDTEQFAGRSAIKVDLREIIDYGGGLGMVPEVQDAAITRMDMWIDQETNVVLGIYADIAMDSADLGDFGLPGETGADTVVMTMDLQLDRIDDPTVTVVIPDS